MLILAFEENSEASLNCTFFEFFRFLHTVYQRRPYYAFANYEQTKAKIVPQNLHLSNCEN